MKNIKLLLIIIICSIYSSASLQAQNDPVRPETALSIFSDWMNKNCGTTEGFKKIITSMVLFADALEPMLIQTYESGPDAGMIRAFDAASTLRYKQMQSYIVSPENILPPTEVQFYKGLSQEDYVKIERDNYILSYRSNALAGLGIIKKDRGMALLKRLSNEASSVYQPYAKLALERPLEE